MEHPESIANCVMRYQNPANFDKEKEREYLKEKTITQLRKLLPKNNEVNKSMKNPIINELIALNINALNKENAKLCKTAYKRETDKKYDDVYPSLKGGKSRRKKKSAKKGSQSRKKKHTKKHRKNSRRKTKSMKRVKKLKK